MTAPSSSKPVSARAPGNALERRFMLSMALVIVALMGPAVFLVRFRAADMFLKSAQARGASIARSIGAVATPALLSYNYVGLEEAASTAAREDDIVYIVIHDKEGLVAGDSRTAGLEARRSTDRVAERALQAPNVLVQRTRVRRADGQFVELIDVAAPVFLPESTEKWGTVRVGISLEPIMQGVARITWSLITLSLLGTALCLWGARWASRRITHPLRTLRDGTLALAQGDLSHRIRINTRDEIEDLAGRFNEMADEIEARQAEAREARGALEILNASLEGEVKERTAAQLRSERRYRTLVEGSPMGIGLVQQGRLVYSNAACRELVGDSADGPLTDAIHDEDRGAFLIQLHEWDRQAPFGPVETRFGAPEGSLRYVEMRWMPLDVDGEAADLVLMTDVTAMRKLQEQVAVSDKLRALGELASGVAHDFNNCLAIILGRCQILGRRTVDPEVKRGLSIIEKAASDGGHTVRRIQDFARMRKDSRREHLDLGEIVRDTVEITRGKWKNEAQGRGVQIDVETRFGHAHRVNGNPAELREALTNLVINAIDAMPSGGRITFATRDDELAGAPCVCLDVSDTGVGMAQELKDKIFDPFFSTKGNMGTGLGLSITYGILSRHHGSIGVESEAGRGTTFSLRIPAGSSDACEAAAPLAQLPFVPCTVLIVDDEPALREVLMEALTDAGHKVTSAPGGREAIRMLDLVQFDVVLTDLGMPEVSGWDVVEAAVARRPNMIIGVVTGWGETLDLQKTRDRGVAFVVSKPFEAEHLQREIQLALAERRRAA